MVYYVRKINKKKSLEKIQTARSVSAIIADVLNEFRITNGFIGVENPRFARNRDSDVSYSYYFR